MKRTKIEQAIYDTKLRLEKVNQDIMLLIREKETLMTQISTLEKIEDSNDFE